MTTSSSTGYRSVPIRGRSSSATPRTEMVVTVAQPAANNNHTNKKDEPAAPKSALKPSSRASSPTTTPRPPPPQPARTDINLDNFETQETIKAVLNSPRSLQVCGRFGIHPTELVHRPLAQFAAPGVPQAVAKMRYEHYERTRLKKLSMLREERHCMPEAAPPTQPHRPPSPARAAPAAAPAQQRPRSAPPPQRRTSSPAKPVAAPANTNTSRTAAAPTPAPAAAAVRPVINAAAMQRAKAIMEANARREEAKQRAVQMKAAREAETLQKQREREEKSRALVHELLEKKLCAAEAQRLKRADAMDHVKQLSRIKEYNSGLRAVEWERKVAADHRDPFAILSAREQYRTPQQRIERARSASAPRPVTN